MVAIEVHFFLDLALVDDWFFGVLGFLVKGFYHVEEVHEVERIFHELRVLFKFDVERREVAMYVGATLLSKFVSAVDAGDRGVQYFLASKIETVFVERQFFLEKSPFVFLRELHDVKVMGEGFDFGSE